ncbi:hypothetical protein ABH922_001139 [Rhodococcus sp. 27YEA15]
MAVRRILIVGPGRTEYASLTSAAPALISARMRTGVDDGNPGRELFHVSAARTTRSRRRPGCAA